MFLFKNEYLFIDKLTFIEERGQYLQWLISKANVLAFNLVFLSVL